MRSRVFLGLLIPTALMLGWAQAPENVAAVEPAGPPSVASLSKEADQVLNTFSGFYQSLSSFTVATTTTISQTLEGQTKDAVVDYTGAMRRPGHFTMALGQSQRGASVYCDGETLTIFVPQLGKYVESAMPGSFEKVGAAGDLGVSGTSAYPTILGVLIADNPRESLLSIASQVTYVGMETDGAQKAHRLSMKIGRAVVDLWIQNGEQPLLLKMREDYTESLLAMLSTPPAGKVELTYTVVFDNWAVNEDVPDSRFAFAAPPGVKKVPSLQALLSGNAPPPSPLLGKVAPDLTLDLLTGGKMNLAAHRGKDIVVIDFWATWCAPCVVSLPKISKLLGEYAGRGVVLYAINRAEDPATIRAFLNSQELDMQVALDPDSEAYTRFQCAGVPMTFVIDKNGIVQAHHVGYSPLTPAELRHQIDELLAGRSLVSEETE